ncbi:malonate decarboxylase holo-ACP synthase [Loigolactobacillus coryniformis]|uniref:malonate decarboxylase holo-ACP synthase n=1 Tax=Loigolactobacillus coryniformis TaxID=1610 RepID=UPI002341AB31|nr:malonate decarboxylase holo-ACP synthase [Loigolactobacillus coryniformis]MDC4185202.1 malonate decarboxylase holo-ACP synthase [Loigolactobacillus coryniformis]
MERIAPHTLLKLKTVTDLIFTGDLPEWVTDMLAQAPYVIVRRGQQDTQIPIGIRGYQKNQRFAAWLPLGAWQQVITPQAALKYLPQLAATRQTLAAFQTLRQITPLLADYQWGVGGSLQYELVTGLPMARAASDVDVIMTLPPKKLTPAMAKQLVTTLKQMSQHVDIQVVANEYGFSLEEYGMQRSTEILVKSNQGPQLFHDPWTFIQERCD